MGKANGKKRVEKDTAQTIKERSMARRERIITLFNTEFQINRLITIT